MLAEELWQHRRNSNYQDDDEFVFCHPAGHDLPAPSASRSRSGQRSRAGISEHVRAFHDLRPTAITNDAAAGSNQIAEANGDDPALLGEPVAVAARR